MDIFLVVECFWSVRCKANKNQLTYFVTVFILLHLYIDNDSPKHLYRTEMVLYRYLGETFEGSLILCRIPIYTAL